MIINIQLYLALFPFTVVYVQYDIWKRYVFILTGWEPADIKLYSIWTNCLNKLMCLNKCDVTAIYHIFIYHFSHKFFIFLNTQKTINTKLIVYEPSYLCMCVRACKCVCVCCSSSLPEKLLLGGIISSFSSMEKHIQKRDASEGYVWNPLKHTLIH